MAVKTLEVRKKMVLGYLTSIWDQRKTPDEITHHLGLSFDAVSQALNELSKEGKISRGERYPTLEIFYVAGKIHMPKRIG